MPVLETRQQLPAVDIQTFREVMGSFASGVSVVTTLAADRTPRGLTCSAVCSVSLDPPLLLVSVTNRSGTLEAIREHGAFGVNLLASQSQAVSQLFASGSTEKFRHVRWSPGKSTGSPVLEVTLAHAECEIHDAVEAGDHTLLIGHVVAGGAAPDHRPLAYWRGGYVRVLR
jgi:flavin reductase (DIM6/NTAB) family NADH-FMN oxidoreductase RutF